MNNSIFLGKVMHKRLLPKAHFLKYSFFQLFMDLQNPCETSLFSLNRFNLFSFFEKDFGPQKNDNKSPLLGRIQGFLKEKNAFDFGDRIYLLTMPRFLGFAFNPISIYFVYGADNSLKAVAYEVNNTFGSRHIYVARISDDTQFHEAQKKMHVSPFMDMDMHYRFRIKKSEDEFRFQIQLFDISNDLFLVASQKSRRLQLNDMNLLKIAFSMPFMTLGVVWGIHWHALKILLKGIGYRHPPKTVIN